MAPEPFGTEAIEREPDEIDAFVDYELTLPQHHDPYKLQVTCPFCKLEWHGLPKGTCNGYTCTP